MTTQDYDGDEGASIWQAGVFDAHCHPTDTMSLVEKIPTMSATAFTIMATRAQDQELVAEVAREHGVKLEDIRSSTSLNDWRGVVPSFGWHPWFSHQMFDDGDAGPEKLEGEAKIAHYQAVLTPKAEDRDFLLALPDPQSLSKFMAETKKRLEEYPLALIGEVGLDKQFRIPEAWLPGQKGMSEDGLTPGGREGRNLSPYRVDLEHQKKILTVQLKLAGRLQRAASVHGVQAHGILYETLHALWKGHETKLPSKREKKRQAENARGREHEAAPVADAELKLEQPFPPRICLHSYSGPPDTLKLYLHPSVPVEFYFSFSTAINFSTAAASKTEEAIKSVPDDRIVVESDLHTAGERMDNALESIVRKVCELKGWQLQQGTQQLANNWKAFVFGGDRLEE